MPRRDFARELEDAADRIADISKADLQIMLRRAVLRLRNVEGVSLDEQMSDALDGVAAEMKLSRSEAIHAILHDWLVGHGMIPYREEEEV